MANTNTGGGTSASIADNTERDRTKLDVSSLSISATHTAQFDSQTNTTQADALGFSGSWANNTDSSTVNAHIGNYAQIVTQSLQVLATNTTEKNLVPSGQNNVSAGSGGVLEGNAAQSTTTIANFTTADVGANANINVTGSITNPGLFELYALNNVDGSDTVNLDTGGVIDGSDATSTIHADTNDATAQIGPGATIYTVGDVNLDTRTTSNLTVAPTVHTYGLASPGSIDGEATIAEDDAVNVGSAALRSGAGQPEPDRRRRYERRPQRSDHGVERVRAERLGRPGLRPHLEMRESTRPIPSMSVPGRCSWQPATPTSWPNSTATRSPMRSAPARTGSRPWQARLPACSAATAFPRTFMPAPASSTRTTTVTVNGTIQLGINNIQSLTIQKDILANPTDYTQTGGITFVQTIESLSADLGQQLLRLRGPDCSVCG